MIKLTPHFKTRFAERVSRQTTRIQTFTERAYYSGADISTIKNGRQRAYLRQIQKAHPQSHIKIYNGFAYCFRQNHAITVLRLPSRTRAGYVLYHPSLIEND